MNSTTSCCSNIKGKLIVIVPTNCVPGDGARNPWVDVRSGGDRHSNCVVPQVRSWARVHVSCTTDTRYKHIYDITTSCLQHSSHCIPGYWYWKASPDHQHQWSDRIAWKWLLHFNFEPVYIDWWGCDQCIQGQGQSWAYEETSEPSQVPCSLQMRIFSMRPSSVTNWLCAETDQ